MNQLYMSVMSDVLHLTSPPWVTRGEHDAQWESWGWRDLPMRGHAQLTQCRSLAGLFGVCRMMTVDIHYLAQPSPAEASTTQSLRSFHLALRAEGTWNAGDKQCKHGVQRKVTFWFCCFFSFSHIECFGSLFKQVIIMLCINGNESD